MKKIKNPAVKPVIEQIVLSHKEAEAGSPKYIPVAGEEDPGAALEDFVEPVHAASPEQKISKKP